MFLFFVRVFVFLLSPGFIYHAMFVSHCCMEVMPPWACDCAKTLTVALYFALGLSYSYRCRLQSYADGLKAPESPADDDSESAK